MGLQARMQCTTPCHACAPLEIMPSIDIRGGFFAFSGDFSSDTFSGASATGCSGSAAGVSTGSVDDMAVSSFVIYFQFICLFVRGVVNRVTAQKRTENKKNKISCFLTPARHFPAQIFVQLAASWMCRAPLQFNPYVKSDSFNFWISMEENLPRVASSKLTRLHFFTTPFSFCSQFPFIDTRHQPVTTL